MRWEHASTLAAVQARCVGRRTDTDTDTDTDTITDTDTDRPTHTYTAHRTHHDTSSIKIIYSIFKLVHARVWAYVFVCQCVIVSRGR